MRINGKVGLREALAIQFVSKYANVAIQLALTAVLARLVSPADYGLIAIVTIFTTFFALLADMGIGPAIVQFKDLDRDDIDGLFVFSALAGAVLLGLFLALAWPIAYLYGNQQLVPIFFAIAPSVLFNTLNMVPNGLLVATAVSGAVATSMAFSGYGVYSLVANVDLQAAIVLAWNFASSGVRIRRVGFVNPLRKVFRYSSYQLGFSFVNYFSRNLDNLLIGRFVGVYDLGIYDKAYKLTTYPIGYLSGIIGSVLQPYMSDKQNQLSALYDQWRRITKKLSLASVPIAALVFACAGEIVLLLYGDQWTEAALPLRLLSMSLYFQLVNNPTGSVFQSTGRTDYLFRHAMVSTSITVAFLVPGLLQRSLAIISLGVAAAYILHTISILYFLVHKVFRESVAGHVAYFVPDACICCLASACGAALDVVGMGLVPRLAMKLLAIGAIVLVGYVLTGQIERLGWRKATMKGDDEREG